MSRCQYGTCQAEAQLAVQPLSFDYPPDPVLLCHDHIADWGMHWRDGHSEFVEEL